MKKSKKVRNRLLTKQLHNRNFKSGGFNINLIVGGLTALILLGFFIYAITFKSVAFDQITALKDYVLMYFKPLFIWTVVLIFFILIFLAFSRVGKVKLGGEDASPSFSNFSWYSMLFSAGMGIGIMFYGVAEPLMYLNSTPLFESDYQTASALATSFLHWGVQAWAIYAIIALALAFYSFNLNLPLAPRSLFYPLLKEKIYGPLGDLIDAAAVVTTLFALSSSLGLGAMQVNSGFNYLFGFPISTGVQIIIIIVITTLATISLVSGVKNGIRMLSELNVNGALVLFLGFLLLGPMGAILKNLFGSVFLYVQMAIPESMLLATYNAEWINSWTIFYWAWWISWSIFVGMFIARVSYGRTVKEFILSVIFVPATLTILWFGVLGSVGIVANEMSNGQLLTMVNQDVSIALYAAIDIIFDSKIIIFLFQIVAVVLVISFFVTSSDSGSLVVEGLTSGGAKKTPRIQKIFWSSIEGVLAIVLIVLGGAQALNLIQMVLIIVSVPLSIMIIFVIVTLPFRLLREHKVVYENPPLD